MRTETAPLAAISAIQMLMGDFRGGRIDFRRQLPDPRYSRELQRLLQRIQVRYPCLLIVDLT